MDDDQQFCLRWNNHQSTLVSVFDNLLEKGTLVDCTLFAEGKFLKAHKVVLSACSPYFETLLTQQYDKHPIFILKDVKYQELKAMMDYMYRGEVNISQDQLAALLKAAESLQIKGLSDSRGGNKENETRKSAAPPVAKTPPPAPAPTLPRVQGLTIEQRKAPKLADSMLEDSRSREGSTSPVPRKRKKARRRGSQDGVGVNDNHDASSSSESHSNQAPATVSAVNIPPLPIAPIALPSTSKLTDVPDPMEAKQEPKSKPQDIPQITKDQKPEIHSELILEPKAEYIEEEMNEDSVEDLTLDDDDVSQMEEMDHARPGPSHGAADGSQGFGGWHMQGNQNQDEVFLAAQEAVGAHRDSQGKNLPHLFRL